MTKHQDTRTSNSVANILVVDDDQDIAEVLADVLRAHGHEIRMTTSGQDGLRLLKSAALPDVVILDVDMPEMTGPQMAHSMLVRDAGQDKIPVILMSGNDRLAQIAERMGSPYFIQKGAGIGAIIGLLNRAVTERRSPSSA